MTTPYERGLSGEKPDFIDKWLDAEDYSEQVAGWHAHLRNEALAERIKEELEDDEADTPNDYDTHTTSGSPEATKDPLAVLILFFLIGLFLGFVGLVFAAFGIFNLAECFIDSFTWWKIIKMTIEFIIAGYLFAFAYIDFETLLKKR